jgi:hypothetical protein
VWYAQETKVRLMDRGALIDDAWRQCAKSTRPLPKIPRIALSLARTNVLGKSEGLGNCLIGNGQGASGQVCSPRFATVSRMLKQNTS